MRKYLITIVLVVMLVGCAYACQEIPPTEPPVDDPPVEEPPIVDEPLAEEPPEEPAEPAEPIVKEEPMMVEMQCTA